MSIFINSRYFLVSKSLLISVFFVLVGLFVLQTTDVNAQTVVNLTADRDNTMFQDVVNSSNGQGHLFAGLNFLPASRRALVHFDVAGTIPAGSTITNVELTLTVNRAAQSGNTDVAIRRLVNDWGESSSLATGGQGQGAPAQVGDATWNARLFNTQLWTTPGGDFAPVDSAVINVGGNGPYTWFSNATTISDVQTWLDTPANNFGWIIIGDETGGGGTAKRYSSREDLTPAMRPNLAITFTAPTAAGVTVGGSVRTEFGRSISNAKVVLTDLNGASQIRYTGSFGLYRFEDLPAGETYVITVTAPRYKFSNTTQVITATDNLSNIDFVAAGF